MPNELHELLIDEMAVDQATLADALRGLVGISSDGSVRPLDGWLDLREHGKVLCGLLALKAARVLGRRESEAMKPTELAEHLGLARGTVQRVLAELSKQRLAAKDARGGYFIPNPTIPRAITAMRTARIRRD